MAERFINKKGCNTMKKLFIAIISIILFLPLANAIIEKPNWKTGIYWKYRVSSMGNYGNMTLKIEGTEKIVVDNKSVESWKIVVYSGGNITEILYFTKANLSLIREIQIIRNRKYESVYSPPLPIIKYSADIGDMWGGVYKCLFKRLYAEKGMNFIINMQSSCVGKEEIVVPAGKFKCYRIEQERIQKLNDRVYKNETTTIYYSSKVGNWVKLIKNESGEITKIELIKTNYGKKKIPFPVYVVFIAMAIVVVVRKLGRRYN